MWSNPIKMKVCSRISCSIRLEYELYNVSEMRRCHLVLFLEILTGGRNGKSGDFTNRQHVVICLWVGGGEIILTPHCRNEFDGILLKLSSTQGRSMHTPCHFELTRCLARNFKTPFKLEPNGTDTKLERMGLASTLESF